MLTQQSTIHGKYHGKTSYLLGNVQAGMGEYTGTGYHVDNVQMKLTDKSQLMKSHRSHTKQSHKQIAQNDHFQMLQSNSGAYGGPETG